MANVGTVDRVVRAIIGVALVYYGITAENYWWILGAVLLATAIFKFCGLYKVLGISTCAKKSPS
ncbi:YgaP family membrane protein [Pseudidiomarina terrestris]|uniref:DUF2892 domain-containing protein n=2 Tax=Pseudidiomarina terrestris TaxID=2820060 RepID=A0AAW7R2L7_9GAMM|nr:MULTISPECIES: DUF2892 domain-containing protein [unclassified Pseudidiomarina]MEA3588547.1 DUF2892 domain-containing protein [Pseudidiomarina sp. 1APP75-27a]MDN7125445.1 DUF2892 domain-containing protein [Pseudidiomarina sp. 1APP75-32.1]MDN7128053.1 DUF2892 domain-containing protein [Pseudidiomarina sp. 1APR75-33.1]MDN7130203.1 DUF2892 domain-containing protein [Pseudidiomarina sp. 1APR75-15]MDN7135712.1 DUF2892 domain-containing protein [Pseudidiomarina sp. 1ASP75-5]